MKNKLKGITLIETLVYIAVFSVVMIMILDFMLTTQESSSRTENKGTVHRAAMFLTQHLGNTFDEISSINETNSVFNTDTGILEVIYTSGPKQYTLSDSKVFYDGIPISPTNVNVTSFNLEPVYQGSSEIVGVRVVINMVSKDDPSITDMVNMLFSLR